jgi:ribonuclease J
VQAGAVVIDGNAVGEVKGRVMKERRELAEDGIIVVSLAIGRNGNLLTPIVVESRGCFVQDEESDVLDEIRAASERVLKEFAGNRRIDAESLSKGIKSRVRDVVRRRSASYAVVMPLISVAGDDRGVGNRLEKEFF